MPYQLTGSSGSSQNLSVNSSNQLQVYHQHQHWLVPKSPTINHNNLNVISPSNSSNSLPPSCLANSNSNVNKIRKIPSTPTFKQSASVIYEEEYEVFNDEDESQLHSINSINNGKGISPIIGRSGGESEDSTSICPMNYFELSPAPKSRKGHQLRQNCSSSNFIASNSQLQQLQQQQLQLQQLQLQQQQQQELNASSPAADSTDSYDQQRDQQPQQQLRQQQCRDSEGEPVSPPVPPHRQSSMHSSASFNSSTNGNGHRQLQRQPSKTFYRSYMREESIFDHSSEANSTQRKLYHRKKSSHHRDHPHHHHHHHRHNRSRSDTHSIRTTASSRSLRERVSDSIDGMSFVLSALYAKLLVIIGLCFPMAEVISRRIPIGWYEGFYCYLYMGSILYLAITYALRIAGKKKQKKQLATAAAAASNTSTSGQVVKNFSAVGGSKSSTDLRRNSSSSSILGTLSSWMCWTSMSSVDSTYDDEVMSQIPSTISPVVGVPPSIAVVAGGSNNKLINNVITVDDVVNESKRFRRRISDTSSECTDEVISTSAPVHFGSFYLRLGAVAFGIGSMIYSGLEFGQFFELESKEHCYNFLYGFTPSVHMAFTFIQLYFIFMNSQALIIKHKFLARFGLMHMIATNLCVWLHVLIQETKHQIMIVVNPNGTTVPTIEIELINKWAHVDSVVEDLSEDYFDSFVNKDKDYASTFASLATSIVTSTTASPISSGRVIKRSIVDHESVTHGHCRRSNVIGQLVQDASQFLFPCTIEYSLICAAILYMMWKHTEIERETTGSNHRLRNRTGNVGGGAASTSTVNQYQHHKYHYQVDCAKAHKGLFCGLFLLVVCIISLILFFVLIKKPNYRHIGVLQAHIVELLIYVINSIAIIIAGSQIRQLRYNKHRNVELDNILLIVAQAGLYIFNMFSLIGAQFYGPSKNTQLVLINAIACIVQATLQTIFILDASRRYCHSTEQTRVKPGREMVTFLLVCNFSMWAINTLETRRAESNPVQLSFFGFWAWNIITHVTTPLTIFYRFHSTVCLCDIWKRVYKLKSEFN